MTIRFFCCCCRCPNCARKGHYAHQCRALSVSQTPKNVLSIVTYDEGRRKRKHVPQPEATHEPEMQYENSFTPRESDSGKRKRLKLELKEKKRKFRSFPHTPNMQMNSNELGPYRARRNATEPASPIEIDPSLNLSVFSVTR